MICTRFSFLASLLSVECHITVATSQIPMEPRYNRLIIRVYVMC